MLTLPLFDADAAIRAAFTRYISIDVFAFAAIDAIYT